MPDDKTDVKSSILIVDDERMVLRVCRRILEREGYHVVLAQGSEQALAYMNQAKGTINLLVCDIRMPGMSGNEVVRQALTMQPDLDVIFVSGHADADEIDDVVTNTRAGFLAKPFSAGELLGAVAAALGS